MKSDKLIIGCLYRPPNSDSSYFDNKLDILEKVASEDKYLVIILGDFNYDFKFDAASLNDNPINMIENLFSLTQLIHNPPGLQAPLLNV